jgi:hypothetical protein
MKHGRKQNVQVAAAVAGAADTAVGAAEVAAADAVATVVAADAAVIEATGAIAAIAGKHSLQAASGSSPVRDNSLEEILSGAGVLRRGGVLGRYALDFSVGVAIAHDGKRSNGTIDERCDVERCFSIVQSFRRGEERR